VVVGAAGFGAGLEQDGAVEWPEGDPVFDSDADVVVDAVAEGDVLAVGADLG